MTVKATIRGQEITLTYDSSTGLYKASVTAPSDSSYTNNTGHYFPVSVTATDDAGNSTTVSDTQGNFKENLKLYVKEKVAPKVTGVSPSSGANITTSNPTFEFNVVDNSNGQSSGFSGINPDTIQLVVNGTTIENSKITKTPITGGFKCSYASEAAIPDGDRTYTVKVNDYDGNTSEMVSTTFKIDTVPPVLEVSQPVDGTSTNKNTVDVIGYTSDATSSPVTVKIYVNGNDTGSVDLDGSGNFVKTVTLSDGENIIKIVSTDKIGKFSEITRTVYLKTTAPVFKSVKIEPNPVDAGNSYTIFVEVV
jgi:hypothetical protein